MTGLFELVSHMPPSLTYSRYLANSGLAVVFFFRRKSKRLRSGWIFFSLGLLLSFFVGFLWRFISPKVEAIDREGKLVLLLKSSFEVPLPPCSLSNFSYLEGLFRVLVDLNMLECVKWERMVLSFRLGMWRWKKNGWWELRMSDRGHFIYDVWFDFSSCVLFDVILGVLFSMFCVQNMRSDWILVDFGAVPQQNSIHN